MKKKRKTPGNDIITRLLNIKIEDASTGKSRPLTDTEIIGITDHLLIGGNETTTFALSNGLWLLFKNQKTYEQLKEDQSKVKNFVEEVLRIESPTQGLYRFVSKDCVFSFLKFLQEQHSVFDMAQAIMIQCVSLIPIRQISAGKMRVDTWLLALEKKSVLAQH